MSIKIKKTLLLSFAVLSSGAVVYLGASPTSQTPDSSAAADFRPKHLSSENSDSEIAIADSLCNAASQLYKDIQFQKTEGEDYAVIFPNVYNCYLTTLQALRQCEPKSEKWINMRSILIDIDYELENGAFYYSSKGNQADLAKFAQAYIDVQLLDEMAGAKWNRNEQAFPTMAYIAASAAYNAKDHEKAIKYFRTYLSTDAMDKRQDVFRFMGYSCLSIPDYDLAINTMRQAVKVYPADYTLYEMALEACQKGKHGELMREFLDPALQLRPDEIKLLELNGQLLEDEHDYQRALEVYNEIDALKPNMLSVNKHIAFNLYNIGISNFNDSQYATDEKEVRKLRRRAKDSFYAAQVKLEEVYAANPSDMRVLRCLGQTYLLLEDKDKFREINRQLQAHNVDIIDEMLHPSINTVENGKNFQTSGSSLAGSFDVVPSYHSFAEKYVNDSLEVFTRRGKLEKMADYEKRVNQLTYTEQYNRLNLQAQKEYLSKYGSRMNISSAKLLPYDPDNETFAIETEFGNITVKVPGNERDVTLFESGFNSIQYSNLNFFIYDDKVTIESVVLKSPTSERTYTYKHDHAGKYKTPFVGKGWDKPATTKPERRVTPTNLAYDGPLSDIDQNIPTTKKVADKTFALIIANEHYANASVVQNALHDGQRFKEYCMKTLGIPEANICLLQNATFGQMISEVDLFRKSVDAFNGNASGIVYYAGHGIPDASTSEAYLMPVDGTPNSVLSCYPLKNLYTTLGEMQSKSTLVFLDACFSGTGRDDNSLTNDRGAVIDVSKPKASGNMLILSAASNKETALPFADKYHGMFTYFLLKKIQETKGDVSLKDLSDYVIDNVKQESIRINRKPQTPTATTSGEIKQEFSTKKLLEK